MSRPSRDTKQLICRRKSMKTARPANRENVLTAGMVDRAPVDMETQKLSASGKGNENQTIQRSFVSNRVNCRSTYLKRKQLSRRTKRGTCWEPPLRGYGQSADEALPPPSAHLSEENKNLLRRQTISTFNNLTNDEVEPNFLGTKNARPSYFKCKKSTDINKTTTGLLRMCHA